MKSLMEFVMVFALCMITMHFAGFASNDQMINACDTAIAVVDALEETDEIYEEYIISIEM